MVLIPLIVQFFSTLTLSLMLSTAESERKTFELLRDVTSTSLLIAKYTYDAEFCLYDYVQLEENTEEMGQRAKASPMHSQTYDELVKPIIREMIKLKELSKNCQPEEKELIKQYIHSMHLLLDKMAEVREALNKGELHSAFALGTIMFYSKNYLQNMSTTMETLIQKEAKVAPRNNSTRDAVHIVIWVFLLINVGVVVGLLIHFNKDTIARLTVLMDNISRLSKQEALNPVLEGKDEFANLDLVFHNMADAMEAAKKREQELLEMKQQIMAMVSHDLRSPLTSLQLTLDLLQKSNYGELNELGKNRVEQSNQSVQRLIRMINDLLDLEKLEAGKMDIELRDLPVEVLISRSVVALEGMAAAKQIRFDFDETELEIKGDGDRLIQVLVNFLSNAVKFSPENSAVRISASLIEEDKMIEIRVSDSGPGIPEKFRQEIFDRYSQLDSEMKSKGSGLGLAICKLIIEMHGGKIGVDAAEGGGSAFWFTVPAAELLIEEA